MKYEKEMLEILVSESKSYSEVCRKLGLKPFAGNRKTLKKYIDKYKIDVSHFTGYANKNERNHYLLNEVLIEKSPYPYTTHLKDRLYREGLKTRKCELCGQGEEWMGKPISLILDHKNGVNDDNRLENLRIVCPNCNATLDTHCGKNVKRDKSNSICECGGYKHKDSEMCGKCRGLTKRKVERPSIELVKNLVHDNGYSATGKIYGVSDNTIRKWIKE